MNSARPNIIPTLLFSAVLLVIGGVIGFLARPLIWPSPEAAAMADGHAAHGNHGAHADHTGHAGHGSSAIVELAETTVANMNLLTGKFEQRDYVHHIRVPSVGRPSDSGFCDSGRSIAAGAETVRTEHHGYVDVRRPVESDVRRIGN